jgi:lipid-binding SYLF domain-containing protein
MRNLRNIWVIVMVCVLNITLLFGQSESKKNKIIADCNTAKTEFIKEDPLMKAIFEKAYAYVIFPNVGKGGLGIGGAAGNGVVYEHNKRIGMAKLSQLSIGFQAGGQAYREVIFFESKKELERFKESRFEFSAQASAVAVTAGASANVKYTDGVMVFSMQKGGLMYEASIGGQKFKFKSL